MIAVRNCWKFTCIDRTVCAPSARLFYAWDAISFTTMAAGPVSIHFVCGESRRPAGNCFATRLLLVLVGWDATAAIVVNEMRETAVIWLYQNHRPFSTPINQTILIYIPDPLHSAYWTSCACMLSLKAQIRIGWTRTIRRLSAGLDVSSPGLRWLGTVVTSHTASNRQPYNTSHVHASKSCTKYSLHLVQSTSTH